MLGLGLGLSLTLSQPPRPIPASFTLLATYNPATALSLPLVPWTGNQEVASSLSPRGTGILVGGSAGGFQQMTLAGVADGAAWQWTSTANGNYDPANPLKFNHETIAIWVNPADDVAHCFTDQGYYYRFPCSASIALEPFKSCPSGQGLINNGDGLLWTYNPGNDTVTAHTPLQPSATALSTAVTFQFPHKNLDVPYESYAGGPLFIDGRPVLFGYNDIEDPLNVCFLNGDGTVTKVPLTGNPGTYVVGVCLAGGFLWVISGDDSKIRKFSINY